MDDSQRWNRIEEIFHRALERPESERDAFLNRICAGDADLEQRVRSLLEGEARIEGFMEAPVARVGDLAPRTGNEARIGPYRILRPLGSGGMGEVFLGVQEGPDFKRYAAIKVVREGVGPDFEDRFARERGILAGLTHPGIARFLGGGKTEEGRPYFVMEHVEGERIDHYADRRVLSIRERVELFRQVCLAVQHAHTNLVVHRDLKPRNILVTPEGAPKLLDFGIAKLLTDETPEVTRTGLRVATPEYAAPEQLTGRPVSTSTDVYALGVLLYESLSGHRPFTVAEATARSLAADPPPFPLPSVAAGRFGTVTVEEEEETVTPEDVSGRRRTDPGGLRRALRGDLDNIVAKAMRVHPDERYVSAAALAEDLERYLTGRPVLARADSLGYRLSKLVRRNRVATLAVMALTATLIVATLATLLQSREIQTQAARVAEERDRALAVQGFLLESFGAAGEPGLVGDSVTIRQVLDGQSRQVERRYADDPATRAEMFHVLADGYERLGVLDEAMVWAARAVEERRGLAATDAPDPELARSLGLLGWIHHERGEIEPAERMLRESLQMWRAIATDSTGLSRALNDLGGVLMTAGQLDESEAMSREALEIRRAIYPANDRAIAITANNLANTLSAKGQPEASVELLEESAAILSAALGETHSRTLLARRNVASMLTALGQHDRAIEESRELVDVYESRGDTLTVAAGRVFGTYGTALAFNGQLPEAEAPMTRALRVIQSRVGDHMETALAQRSLLGLYRAMGRRTEALQLARAAVGVHRRINPDPENASLAEALRVQGSLATERAEQTESYREAMDIYRRLEGDDGPRTVRLTMSLARSLAADSRHAEALVLFEELQTTVPAAYGEDHAYAPAPYLGQAEAHAALGNHEAARFALNEARTRMRGDADVAPNQQWLSRAEAAVGSGG